MTDWFFREIQDKVLKFCLLGGWGWGGGDVSQIMLKSGWGCSPLLLHYKIVEKKNLLPTAPSVDQLVSVGSLGNTLMGAGSRVTTTHILANPSNLIIFHSMYIRGVHQTMVVQCLTCIVRSQTCRWYMTRFSVGKGFLFRPYHSSPLLPLSSFA
jgi:hypothetical protein